MNQQFTAKGEDGVPRVSVVVPAYNVADYLEHALNSALAQTMPDLEVIVVDDASNDATFEVASQVAARDSRVRVLRNERNSGPAASRNRAISAARGEWIALLDGDDTWLPERLEWMLAYADGTDAISDDVYLVRGPSTRFGKRRIWTLLRHQGLTLTKPQQLSLFDFVRYDLGLAQPIVRRSFLDRHHLRYDPALRVAEDFRLNFEMLALGARWLQLPWAYYLYTFERVDSLSYARSRLWQDMIENTKLLRKHPAVMGNEMLASTLEHRILANRNVWVYVTARGMLRQRCFVRLARFLFARPSRLFVTAKLAAKALCLRLDIRSCKPLEIERP